MEPSVVATIISVTATIVVSLCGSFMWDVRRKIDKLDKKIETKIDKLDKKVETKIDKLDKKVETKIDKLDEKVNTLTASVAAIAATQAEHGKKLEHMMGHGERISALEGANFGTAAT